MNGFNRTSFQQQLKRDRDLQKTVACCFNRTSFQQQLKHFFRRRRMALWTLQSYILSTTTETQIAALYALAAIGFNRTSFQQQLKLLGKLVNVFVTVGFNRTSFQQQLKLIPKKGKFRP